MLEDVSLEGGGSVEPLRAVLVFSHEVGNCLVNYIIFYNCQINLYIITDIYPYLSCGFVPNLNSSSSGRGRYYLRSDSRRDTSTVAVAAVDSPFKCMRPAWDYPDSSYRTAGSSYY